MTCKWVDAGVGNRERERERGAFEDVSDADDENDDDADPLEGHGLLMCTCFAGVCGCVCAELAEMRKVCAIAIN